LGYKKISKQISAASRSITPGGESSDCSGKFIIHSLSILKVGSGVNIYHLQGIVDAMEDGEYQWPLDQITAPVDTE
jgi:hypothetical protein